VNDKSVSESKVRHYFHVTVGMDANSRVKHGVPKMEGAVGVSGSLVGRSIKNTISWEKVDKETNRLYKSRGERAIEKQSSN